MIWLILIAPSLSRGGGIRSTVSATEPVQAPLAVTRARAGTPPTAGTAAARTGPRRNARGSRTATDAPDAARSAARRHARPADGGRAADRGAPASRDRHGSAAR